MKSMIQMAREAGWSGCRALHFRLIRDFQAHVLQEADAIERRSKILAKNDQELQYQLCQVERLRRDAEVAEKLLGALDQLPVPGSKSEPETTEIV